MLRPEWRWRPRALASFLGYVDIKTGVTMALLFALLNKVAGVYGLIVIFTGGSLAQLSLYVYSVLALVAFAWGLNAVAEEDPRKTLYFAHLYFVDHILSTMWTVFFGVLWWVYNPHDGQRIANSEAQKNMMGSAGNHTMTDEERKEAAQLIWNKEKGLAAGVLIAGWLIKIYFALLLYSYASHLRKGTYRGLPLTNPPPGSSNGHIPFTALDTNPGDADEYDLADQDDFYRMQMTGGGGQNPESIGSFAEFVAAPSRTRRGGGVGGGGGLSGKRGGTNGNGGVYQGRGRDVEDQAEEVLWDGGEDVGDGGSDIGEAVSNTSRSRTPLGAR